MTTKTFRTFCIISLQDTQKLNDLLTEDNILRFYSDPIKKHWQNVDGSLLTTLEFDGNISQLTKDTLAQNEVLISVSKIDMAENMMSTIHGGMLLAYPDPMLANRIFEIHELSSDFNEVLYGDKWYYGKFNRQDNFYFGVLVWQIAVKDKMLLYAIEKYKLSLSLDSFTPHSANPKYGQIFDNYNSQYSYHTTAAFAIISAFSAIEELGLEIRSSKENPRFLNREAGEWNPEVLANINKRLFNIGILEAERIDWIFRGKSTKIEESLIPYFEVASEWVDGNEVRDKSLTFPEALENASYLRNFIASETVK